jgi:photosystem II stability/assembly factor-like uncharacterized protein
MRFSRLHALRAAVALAGVAGAMPLAAQQLDSATNAGLRWRQIGPANMAGRIVDVEGIPSPSRTFYVSTAGGGLWKTSNGGLTFRPVLDTSRVISGGDLAIAPSDTNTIYWGTGEPNTRNSISPGGGIYKSTDGGKSWTYLDALRGSQHIGRIVVHPTNPNVAWVAALGPAWRTGGERGLYKTTDGGKTFTCVKCIDDKTGFIDVDLHPSNPDVVFAASYERLRGPYFLQSGGKGSAMWKSTDGGTTWAEVKGGGFPEGMKGRMELAISMSKPDVMYAMVEADTLPNASKEKKAAQKSPSGLYRTEDGGKTWEKRNDENVRPFYYSQVRVHPTNPDRVWWSSTPVKYSNDGGKTAGNATVGIHVDHHAHWIDPKDPERMIVGNDGGVAISFDGGGNYDFLNTFAIGQFYNVSVDNSIPFRVCGGAQDNGSWCGPSRRKQGSVSNAMWATFWGGDGFVSQNDPTDPNIVYGTSQGGSMGRYNWATGEASRFQKPEWRTQWLKWEDSIVVARGDTMTPETADMKRRIAAFKTRQKQDSVDLALRWNWNTPYFISKHNAKTLYFGANRVLKSTKMGDDMFFISGDLTYRDTAKLRVALKETGGITKDITGAETFSTIVSLNESPVKAGMLLAGTDDGRLWVTRNDGGAWEELTARVPGVPAGTYVSRVELSYADTNVFYVTYDNHRRGDFTPYVLASRDGGKSFQSIVGNLPTGGPDFAHVVREDPKNASVLYVGTDVGAYVSVDRGGSWRKLGRDLPTVPVHDLVVHLRDGELVAATHGRSFWVVDINPLQQLGDAAKQAEGFALYKPRTAFQWGEPPVEGRDGGNKRFEAPSPTYGADIWYRTSKPGLGAVRIVLQDASGDTLRTLTGPSGVGLHRVSWNFRGKEPARVALSPAELRDSLKTARAVDSALTALEKEGKYTKPQLDQVRNLMARGAGGMAQMAEQMFAGGQGAGRYQDRPGETPARAGGAGGGRGGAGGAAAAMGEGAPDMNMMQDIFGALRNIPGVNLGFGGGGGRRGGGQAPIVQPGDYKLSVTIDGKTHVQTVRVERISGTGASSFGFEDEDEFEP